jgi:hypothetical protein
MRSHSHGLICAFDSFMRHAWFNQSQFSLSDALHASARKKHDSSGKGNAMCKLSLV